MVAKKIKKIKLFPAVHFKEPSRNKMKQCYILFATMIQKTLPSLQDVET